MENTQKDPDVKSRDPHGLIKLVLIVAGFIALMIALKYILDLLQK